MAFLVVVVPVTVLGVVRLVVVVAVVFHNVLVVISVAAEVFVIKGH